MALKIISVVGARPNFIKIAAICDAINESNKVLSSETIEHVLVHTGQHYDVSMSDAFFRDLELPKPDVFLEVGSASHSVQTARIMERFEQVLLRENPNCVLVVGDVNSTVGCALAVKKTSCTDPNDNSEYIPALAHVEAGLRSFDRAMPEEINRIVTDCLSDVLFTTEESANRNLLREGIAKEKIHFVGNVMIDTLLRHRVKAEKSTILRDFQLLRNGVAMPFAVLTLHRPANVDDQETFARLLQALGEIARHIPIIFPAHPRTLKRIRDSQFAEYFVDERLSGRELSQSTARIRLVPALGYLDFLCLMSHANVVLTDSGGIQEESTILQVPCITLRENTERPVTIEQGTNVLAGSDPSSIIRAFTRMFQKGINSHQRPEYWDGNAARRIVTTLLQSSLPGKSNPRTSWAGEAIAEPGQR